MSYTTSAQLRTYLVDQYPLADRIVNQPLSLIEEQSQSFFGGPLEASSLVVKGIRQTVLSRTSLQLKVSGSPLPDQQIAFGSVVCADSSSLGTVLVPGVDYRINLISGLLFRVDSSSRPENSVVTIWWLPFHRFDATDVVLDADRGSIRRSGSSAIGSNEQIWIDYQPVFRTLTDEIVASAATSANQLIEREIDPNRQFESDPLLGAAATYRGLEIVCRISASRDLAAGAGRSQSWNGWLELAAIYDARSRELLSQFRPPAVGLRSPEQA